jgi:RNA polymerase sigma factor FliA
LTRRTLRSLWSHYFRVSKRLAEVDMSSDERRQAEREARGLRDRLVVNYSPLVKYVAGRVSGRMAGPIDQEDVVAAGLFGLLNAVETYDPDRRTKFESYAISKIRWSILDELRKLDPLSRRTRLRAHQTERTRDELVQKLGRPPTESELAGRLGISVAEHRRFLDQYARAQVRSLGDRPSVCCGSGRGSRAAGSGHRGPRRAATGGHHLLLLRWPYAEGDRRGPTPDRRSHSQILYSALSRLRQSLTEETRLSERT